MPTGSKLLRCYAEERDNSWEAFCLDFDLAVQGHSFKDVYDKLNDQIELFLEGVKAAPQKERARLLGRSAPLGVWLRVAVLTLFAGKDAKGNRPERHSYSHRIDNDDRAAA